MIKTLEQVLEPYHLGRMRGREIMKKKVADIAKHI